MKIRGKKQSAEARMLHKLQKEHGYTLMRTKRPADRHVSMFSFKKGTMRDCYVVRIAVPINSALAKAMIESDKVLDKRKGVKE